MTLKISTPNIPLRKLMREDMRHRSWMLTLSCLGSFIASPVLFLFTYTFSPGSEYQSARLDAAAAIDPAMAARELSVRFHNYFAMEHLFFQMIVLFIGALILAIRGFQYLYSRRMIDLYHSTPATRERIFLAIWLDGFLIWFLPFLLGHLSVYILALYQIRMPAFWGGLTVLMLKELGLLTLCFLILYNACLVPVMISGNAKNAFVNMLIYGLTVLLAYGTYFGYMSRYLDTFYSRDDGFLTSPFIALSPLASPIFLCGYFSGRQSRILSAKLMIDTPRWIALLAVSVLLMLVNLFVAMALHKRRPSELAERGVENPWFRIPLNAIASVLAGLLLSLFFSVIEWEKHLGWTLFGAVFGCVLTFACMNILHHASFKALFRHKLQLGLTLAFTLGVTLIFFYDAFGYDRYLPREKDITGITLYCSSFCGTDFGYVKGEDGLYTHSYTTVFDAPDNITFTDREQNYQLLKTLVDQSNNRPELISKDSRTLSVSVRVHTTHGSYVRTYFVYYQTVSDLEALKPFVESAEFREFNHPAASGVLDPPDEIRVTSLDNRVFILKEPQRIEQLYQAYAQDFAEHFDIACALKNSDRTLQLDYGYPSLVSKKGTEYYTHLYMGVPAWYERTTALLQECFPEAVWTKEDLNLTSLSVDISIAVAGDTLASLQSYLSGVSENSGYFGKAYYWGRVITDPAELKALQPYLYVGTYKNDDFIPIGSLTTLHADDPLQCYMKRGEIPPGFAESLRFVDMNSATR